MSDESNTPSRRRVKWCLQLLLGVAAGLVAVWIIPSAPLWQSVIGWLGFWFLLGVRDGVLRA